ncbi:DUF4157 domain-containing protein [Rubrivirga sp.]|uniref:eCIS core domain-containing protein n=1 Tax=Rubrivirga sp. TaxID=1885344 RepID=UPI003B52D338
MKTPVLSPTHRTAPEPVRSSSMLQRCACGGQKGPSGECAECRRKRLARTRLQPKLTVNTPGDRYEREADRVADAVTRAPADAAPLAAPLEVQRVGTGGAGVEAPASVDAVLASPGQPLDGETRQFMEARMGHDFSGVRVHTGSRAAASAREVGARAYTVGRDVAFGTGEYRPDTAGGRRLLAHELMHVAQQRSGRVVQRFVDEKEVARQLAQRTAQTVAREGATHRVVAKAGWGHFWKIVVAQFALRGGTAATIAAADGPIPAGDLIALGLAVWTVYDIVRLWDVLWELADQLAASTSSSPTPKPVPKPVPDEGSDSPPTEPSHENQRDRCVDKTMYVCNEYESSELYRDEIIMQYFHKNVSQDTIIDCSPARIDNYESIVYDCNYQPGWSYHCYVGKHSVPMSIFKCLCCNDDGTDGFIWSDKSHKSRGLYH